MKAISLHQPWAHAIATGTQRFDIRSWRTGHRGELMVHAAQTRLSDLRNLWLRKPWRDWLAGWGFEKPLDVPISALIGMVHLKNCVPLEEFGFAPGEKPASLPERGWVWEFEQARLFPNPRLYPGRLGVFEVK
ncbi:MAG: hypothetical protein ACK47R_22160 [Planctomycetia bacterium]